MEKILNQQEGPVNRDKLESEIRQQLFEKVGRKMAELGYDSASPFHQVNPDVVIIPADHVLLFEPQNWSATEWLHRHCGLSMDKAQVRDQIHVHPCQRGKIIADLKAAGFEVV